MNFGQRCSLCLLIYNLALSNHFDQHFDQHLTFKYTLRSIITLVDYATILCLRKHLDHDIKTLYAQFDETSGFTVHFELMLYY